MTIVKVIAIFTKEEVKVDIFFSNGEGRTEFMTRKQFSNFMRGIKLN